MIYTIWILIFLGVCTLTDLKDRNIYTVWCIINGILGIGINLVLKDHSMGNLITGVAIGFVFVMISALTKQKIGFGDALVITTIGLILGGTLCFSIIIWAFLLCSVISTAGMMALKLKINTSMPFMPFLFMGCIITLILNGA